MKSLLIQNIPSVVADKDLYLILNSRMKNITDIKMIENPSKIGFNLGALVVNC